MDITKIALKNASGVAIAVALIVFVGLYSLFKLPVQLFPDIERPQISIQTFVDHQISDFRVMSFHRF